MSVPVTAAEPACRLEDPLAAGRRIDHGRSIRVRRHAATAGLAAAAAAIVVVVLHATPLGQPAATEPVAATTYLRRHAGGQRVFAPYRWGGYLVDRQVPVYIDGAADIYGHTNLYRTYLSVKNGDVSPAATFRSLNVRWVLWPHGPNPVAAGLAAAPGWAVAARTATAWVWHRIGPSHQGAR